MRGKVVRTRKVHPIGGDRREIDSTAEAEGVVHSRPWCQLSIEILPRVFGPSDECCFVVREDDQSVAIAGDRREEVERGITVAFREKATKIRIAVRCFGQQNRAMVVGRQLGAENRPETLLLGLLDKSDRSVQSVRIGQGYGRRSLSLCREAKFFQW
jgi:hypothetical protein